MNSQDIVLSEDEQIELSRRIRSATIRQRDGRRARVILLAAQGCSRNEIARLTGLSVVSVTRWCKRFQELRLQGLVDLPGRGRKPSLPAEALKRTLEQVTQPRIGQPRWSCRSMARVAGISPASVQRIWAANDIKPHLTRTFKLSNDPNFEEKFWDVIGLYLDPPDKALVLCCDEKSQVQALERTQPGLPLGIGHIRTQSHDYIRHGTVTLRAWLEKHKRFHMHFTPTSSSWMNMVERFFRDITVYLRDGSFSSVRELESSITTFLALRNAQPTRYVWNAKGEDILNKIQRAREAMVSQG
ncbi:IS630 family transposase [Pseudomonas aeruginosa]|uniref:IS630 family transposase n=1 Tax=Pseudomonas aeruginosa TaxID=287 RepID=UPI000BB569F2|nr:IS630 family transposase [Pseudomonas aeruginosa]PBM15906.1 IS630 family transposase [Pseudomonas aeruginosa]